MGHSKKALLSTGSVMVALSAFVPNNYEALANTASFAPTAQVVNPIVVDKVQELQFGKLAVGASGGKLIVNSAGIQSQEGDVQALGGDYQVGKVRITGPDTEMLKLSITGLAGGAIALDGPGGESLEIKKFLFSNPDSTNITFPGDAFTLSTATASTQLMFLTNQNSTTLDFGAELTGAGTEGSGTYTGSFTVSVTFP